MELIKNTLFINLEQRTDRLEHVQSELSKLDVKIFLRSCLLGGVLLLTNSINKPTTSHLY
jgi:hypothetical protein